MREGRREGGTKYGRKEEGGRKEKVLEVNRTPTIHTPK